MPKKKIPVILMDCDTRAIEGIIYSFGKRNIPVIALSNKKNPSAFYSRYVTKKYQSPSVAEEDDYLEFLINLPEKGVLVYPDDASASLVNKHQERLRKAGFLINSPSSESFNRGFDKAQVFLAAQEVGIPTIPTVPVNSFADLQKAWNELDKPIILKATRLAGGKFMLIHQESELEQTYKAMNEVNNSPNHWHLNSGLIAQEYIYYNYDQNYSCETFYSSNSEPAGFMPIKKIRPNINRDGTSGGRLFAGETIEDPKLVNYTKTLLDSLNWKSIGHVEWVYSEKYNNYLLCEINPRLPGYSNFPTKMGFELAYHYYADLCNLPVEPYSFQKGFYFEALRMPGDITTGIYAISKGYLDWKSFINSYVQILSFKHNVCLDIFYPSDPLFTFKCWSEHFLYLLKRPFRSFIRQNGTSFPVAGRMIEVKKKESLELE